MSLPTPPSQYNANEEAQNRAAIDRMDRMNRKSNADLVVPVGQRFIMADDTGALGVVTVSGGVFTWTALP